MKQIFSVTKEDKIPFWMKIISLSLMRLLWKTFQELSEIFTIMEFDFSKPIKPCYGKAQVFHLRLVNKVAFSSQNKVVLRLGHSCKNLVIRWLILVLIFQYLLWWFIFLNLVAKHTKSLVAQLAFLGVLIKMSSIQITPPSTIEL